MELFALLHRNSPNFVQELESPLRSCALESNRVLLKRNVDAGSFAGAYSPEMDLQETAESLDKGFCVDQRIRKTEEVIWRQFKGYGEGNPRSRFGRAQAVL